MKNQIHFSYLIIFTCLMSCSSPENETDPTPIQPSTTEYTLTVSSGTGGSVSTSGGTYEEGSTVNITATPNSEYIFQNWSNGSTDNPLTVTVNQNITLTANFIKRKYPLTINIQGEGTVREEIVSSGKSTPTEYNSGTVVRLTADPTGDWIFEEWTGNVTETSSTITITLDEPKSVNVRFMRYFNYNQPSYFFQNSPLWIDICQVVNNNQAVYNSYGDFMSYDAGQGIGDFNQDGYLDVIVAPSGSDNVVRRYPVEIYLNRGDDVSFVHAPDLIQNNLGPTTSRKTIIGDFNGDQIVDAFFTDHSIHNGFPGGIPSVVLSQNEGYTFSILDQLPNGFYHSSSSGDFDNDGDLDIYVSAIGNTNPNIDTESIFLINDGIGNFSIDEDVFNTSTPPVTSELFDLDRDGYLDLIISGDALLDTPTRVYWGNGVNFTEDRTDIIAQPDNIFPDVYDIDIYDLNSDSFNDIVLLRFDYRTNHSYVQIIINSNNDTFTDQTTELIDNIDNKVHNIVWLSLFDIDNDGYIDLFETDKGHYNSDYYGWEGVNGDIPAHWEWNGQRFIKITNP